MAAAHGLLYEADIFRCRASRGVVDGVSLNARNARGDADHNADLCKRSVFCDLLYESLEHIRRDVEVGDNAVLEGTDCGYGAGSSADHLFSLRAYGDNSGRVVLLVDRNNGGLSDDDALALYENKSVGGTQIDTDIK